MEELCRTNLLDHIRRMQDGIETRLDLVEEQVAGQCRTSNCSLLVNGNHVIAVGIIRIK